MNMRHNVPHKLLRVGHYQSPIGGAPSPFRIPAGEWCFELIIDGAVYDHSGEHLRGPGWIFSHQPGKTTIWRTPPDGMYACFIVIFEAEGLDEESLDQFFWGNIVQARVFAEEMLASYHMGGMNTQLLGDLIWSQFRYRMISHRGHEYAATIPASIAYIIEYIEKNYTEDCGVDELAEMINLSSSHFHAVFKEHVGMSPHHYIIQQRLRAARHLLVTTDDPIRLVAERVGYVNIETFSRAFRKNCGCTAALYRRRFTRGVLLGSASHVDGRKQSD